MFYANRRQSTGSTSQNNSFGQVPISTQLTIRTKYAISFLCLFDGLRTPSIRRLVRRPRTICDKPLLTFDPSFYAPSTKTALQEVYKDALNCPCEITVDPSVQTVLSLLRKHTTSMPPHRVILHYCGYGVLQPNADGCIFFFTEDRQRYKPLKLQNIVQACACPLCLIFDCQNAAVLAPQVVNKNDLFAFFSCAEGESLPLSPSMPMDIFSSCLLRPFTTALEWHLQHCTFESNHMVKAENRQQVLNDDYRYDDQDEIRPVLRYDDDNADYNIPSRKVEETKIKDNKKESDFESKYPLTNNQRRFLESFFIAVLDSIILEAQGSELQNMKVPSVASLTRGFALSQRILKLFNVHPSTVPFLKPMDSSELWEFWDLVLDLSMSLNDDECEKTVFNLFISSFQRFPFNGLIPIFAFWIGRTNFHDQSCKTFIKYIDDDPYSAAIAVRTSIPKTIIELQNPSPKSLLILAKIIACASTGIYLSNLTPGEIVPFDQQSPLFFASSSDKKVLSYGMLAVACSIKSNNLASFNKLITTCLDNAAKCAPFSPLLLGLLLERAGKLMNPPSFSDSFFSLLESDREDIRATTVFAIGATKEKKYLKHIIQLLKTEQSTYVKKQALLSILSLSTDKSAIACVNNIASTDTNDSIKELANDIASILEGKKIQEPNSPTQPKFNPIIDDLIQCVSSPNFCSTLKTNVFKAVY